MTPLISLGVSTPMSTVGSNLDLEVMSLNENHVPYFPESIPESVSLEFDQAQSISGPTKTPVTPEGYGMGLIFQDMTEFDNLRRTKDESYSTSQNDGDNPTSVFNLAGLPPIGNQGSQGSCVGWAWGYYCLTHQIAAANGFWDVTIPSHQFSPAFIYNHINFGDDTGSLHLDASYLLETVGCSSMDSMPYDSGDYTTWPIASDYTEAMKYRTTNMNFDYLYTDDDLEILKSYLASGNTAVTSILVRTAFSSFDDVNNIYTTEHASGDYLGGHAVCVVGYDDTKATTDGPGAFMLVNSWGLGWGDNGFWWMSYEAIKNSALSRRIFYYCDVISQPYNPSLVASFRISHEKRGDLLYTGIDIEMEQDGWTCWSETYFNFDMADTSGLYQNYPFPGNHIVLDISDAAYYLSPYYDNEFNIYVEDSVWPEPGVLESFSVYSYDLGIGASSSGVPHTILDNLPGMEITATMIYPSISIDSVDSYVGGVVEITGTAQGKNESTIVDVGFEPGSFEGLWFTFDDDPNNGDQLWGIDSYHSYSGGRSLWCGGVPSSSAVYTEHFNPLLWLGWPLGWSLYSAGGNSNPWTAVGVPLEYEIMCSTGGLADIKEWAYYGPLDTSSATELCLTFWMDYEIENAQADNFASVLYSTDGTTFTYLKRWWAPVGETCSFVGEQKVMLPEDAISSTLYFAFIFQGDYAGSMTVDDIDIWDLGSEYENDADSYAYCYVDLEGFDTSTMSFDYWADVEAGFDWFSPAYYTSSGWTVPYHLESTSGWSHFSMPVPTSATRIGFYFHSDSSIVRHGVYIDNVNLIGRTNSISQIEMSIDEVFQGYATGSASWSYVWDTESFPDGLHDILASAIFGGMVLSNTESTFIDNTAPLLTSLMDEFQNGNNITIDGYADSLGGSGIVSLEFTYGSVSQYFQAPLTGEIIDETTVYWLLANSSAIPDGYYEFGMELIDYCGNSHELAFSLTVDNQHPDINSPEDFDYVEGTTGNLIDWICSDLNPDTYDLYLNGVLQISDDWITGLEYSVDGLSEGSYNFTVVFWDLAGNFVVDTVIVTVNPISITPTDTTPTPTDTTPTDTSTSTGTQPTSPASPEPLDITFIVAIASGAVIVIMVILVIMKRK